MVDENAARLTNGRSGKVAARHLMDQSTKVLYGPAALLDLARDVDGAMMRCSPTQRAQSRQKNRRQHQIRGYPFTRNAQD